MSKLIFASCIGSFCNGGLLVAMVLFYSLSIEVHYRMERSTLDRRYNSNGLQHHGLGFDPLRNGIAFTIFAGAGFIFQVCTERGIVHVLRVLLTCLQIYAFKKLLARLGVVKMYMMSALLLCLGSILLPSTSFIYWIFGTSKPFF